MDLGNLISALSRDEREELLDRLTAEAEGAGEASGDAEDASGCCGGAGPRGRRRASKREMRHACCRA